MGDSDRAAPAPPGPSSAPVPGSDPGRGPEGCARGHDPRGSHGGPRGVAERRPAPWASERPLGRELRETLPATLFAEGVGWSRVGDASWRARARRMAHRLVDAVFDAGTAAESPARASEFAFADAVQARLRRVVLKMHLRSVLRGLAHPRDGDALPRPGSNLYRELTNEIDPPQHRRRKRGRKKRGGGGEL